VKQICDSQLLKDREMILSTVHPDVGEMKVVGNPVKMSGSKAGIRRPPPKLGEHTKEVLSSLGYKLDEIEGMVGTDVL
jgi:crotonobetainyl-CoA:carnitine CoA-transferase CaiB-like acyl-CoA transferase